MTLVAEAPGRGPELLTVENLSVTFGTVKALAGVTCSLHAGEVVGLIGPNGAGKTTFIDAITGFVPTKGSTTLAGDSITGLTPHERTRRGLTRTFQSMELFQDLSVRQNILVAAENGARTGGSRRAKRKELDQIVDAALANMHLEDVADVSPGLLSLGRQKLVSVARALASGARVLLLDEPAAGLDSDESLEFAEHLRTGIGDDVAVLLIDHDLDLVNSACQRLVVLSFGQIIATGTPAEIAVNDVVRASYLGIDVPTERVSL